MKKILSFVVLLSSSLTLIYGQEAEKTESKYLMGFSLVLPTGVLAATALTNSMGPEVEYKSTLKTYGFGVMFQRKITQNFNLFLDGNTYSYNFKLAKKGQDLQTIWTTGEGAIHWDEPGAPQQLFIHDFATDVYFDMRATGFRLGGKYIFGKKKIHPWFGAGYGFYRWDVNYCNGDKTQTYGKDGGYVTGLTYLAGVDFEPMSGIIISAFFDGASPIANYKIKGLFYPQWEIDYNSPIMGAYRFGINILFAPGSPSKKKN